LSISKQINQKIWIGSLIGSMIIVTALYSTNGIIDDELFEYYIAIPAYIIIPAIPIGISIWALKVSGKIKIIPTKTLIFFTASFSCTFVAEQIWLVYWYVLDIDPFPSPADFLYILSYPLMFAGLIVFIRPSWKLVSKTSLAFSVGVSAFVLIPSLAVSFMSDLEYDAIDFFFALSYPILDSLLLVPAFVILISFSMKGERSSFWIMMLLGIIVFVAADTLFLFIDIDDSYYDGHPVDILWLYSYLLWTFAIYRIVVEKKISRDTVDNKTYVDKQDFKSENIHKFGITIVLVIIKILFIYISFIVNSISRNFFSNNNSINCK